MGKILYFSSLSSDERRMIIDYLFKEAKVDKVIAYHQVENTASGRVMQKSGMHLDATLENYMIDKTTKKRTGIVMYSIDRIK